jgi:hypothetical protein
MSTLWFSLAIRETIDTLQSRLGPDHLVLAYLDDVFVLAPDASSFNETLSHFDSAPVRLNPSKCKIFDLRDTATQPIHLLGSCIGDKAGRESFLLAKIAKLETDLQSLRLLPAQHALLVLRKSLQHKLRHLMQHLYSADLPHLWKRLDASLWDAFDAIRHLIPSQITHKRDRDLISLPTALGGCGMFSHLEIAPLAHQAAHATSSATLQQLVPSLRPDIDTQSQRDLSQEAFLIKQELLMASLDSRDRILVVEAASQVGRRWLDAIPTNGRFKLSDHDVRAGLHYRTLHPGYQGACRHCAAPNLAAHDEACQGKQDYRVSRHEKIKKAIGEGLKMIPELEVQVEPFMPDLRRRNDIRLYRAPEGESPAFNEEYDLKVPVLSAPTNQRSLNVAFPPSDLTIFKQTSDRIFTVLAYLAKRKVMALPPTLANQPAANPFYPLVMSSGGVMERSMFEKLKEWKSWSAGSVSHNWMLSTMSVRLVSSRGRTFTAA